MDFKFIYIFKINAHFRITSNVMFWYKQINTKWPYPWINAHFKINIFGANKYVLVSKHKSKSILSRFIGFLIISILFVKFTIYKHKYREKSRYCAISCVPYFINTQLIIHNNKYLIGQGSNSKIPKNMKI